MAMPSKVAQVEQAVLTFYQSPTPENDEWLRMYVQPDLHLAKESDQISLESMVPVPCGDQSLGEFETRLE